MKKKEIWMAVVAGFIGGAFSNQIFQAMPAFASDVTRGRVLSVEKLLITDRNGTARVGFGVTEDGRVTMAVSDQKGRVRIGFGILADGNPSLDFYDLANKARMVVGLKDEAPFLVFNDKDEIHRILLRESAGGSPHLDFNDSRGNLRATMGWTPYGGVDKSTGQRAEASYALLNEGGKPIWQAPN